MEETERPVLPAAIRAVAYFTILCGVGTLLSMIVALTKGHLSLNIGVLQIPAGFGILRLSRGWRTFQLWMLWFGMIGFGIGFVVFLSGFADPQLKDYGGFIQARSRELLTVACALMFGVMFWQYRVLTSREARLLFGITVLSRARSRKPPGGPGTGAGPGGSSSGPLPGS